MSRPTFNRVFFSWWLVLTLLPAVLLAAVGRALSTYHTVPQSLFDLVTWCSHVLVAALFVAPLTAVIAFLLTAALTRPYAGLPLSTQTRRCSNCDYALTGNTSGICPECGTPTATRARPPSNRKATLVVIGILTLSLLVWIATALTPALLAL